MSAHPLDGNDQLMTRDEVIEFIAAELCCDAEMAADFLDQQIKAGMIVPEFVH